VFPNNTEFWAGEDIALWESVDDIALATVISGAASGVELLPNAIKPLVNENSFNSAAMAYLRRYRLVDVPNLNATTRKSVVRMIEDWLRSGESLSSLETQLGTILGSRRAAMIAITEVTRIFAEGNLMLWRATGVVTSKVWRTARDERVCPLCGPLDGVVVSMESNFTQDAELVGASSQMKALLGARWSPELGMRRAQNMFKWNSSEVQAPPRHVNCRCWLAPVVSVQAFEESLGGILK